MVNWMCDYEMIGVCVHSLCTVCAVGTHQPYSASLNMGDCGRVGTSGQHMEMFVFISTRCFSSVYLLFQKLGFPPLFFLLSASLPPASFSLSELISMLHVCVFHLGLPLEIFACLCCSARRSTNSGGLIPGRGRPLKGPLVLSGQAPFRE